MKKRSRSPLACLLLVPWLLAIGASNLHAQSPDSPGVVLATWQSALAQRDHAAYLACLHSAARAVPEYASPEAMAFWAGQIADLTRQGFTGEFSIEAVDVTNERFPPGAVRARPIVEDGPIDDAIILAPEQGRWTILRLFS